MIDPHVDTYYRDELVQLYLYMSTHTDLCVCIYIHVHTYVCRTYMYVHAYTHMHVYIIYMYTCIRVRTYVCIRYLCGSLRPTGKDFRNSWGRLLKVCGGPVAVWYMGGCQNYGPLLGSLNTRGRTILRTQKGTIVLTTTHIPIHTYTASFIEEGTAHG